MGFADDARLVENAEQLEDLAVALQGASTLYLDTEFESSRRGKTLCLLQISRGEEIWIVDTLRLPSLEPLRDVMGNPGVEWVLHAGLQDVELLLPALRLTTLPKIFDTQVAWALLGPEASVGLSYLTFRVLDIRTAKPHQADDWVRRPLPQAQLRYAAGDIEHLPEIHAQLAREAAELARYEIILDASRDVVLPPLEPPEPLSLSSFRNAWQLGQNAQLGLQRLIRWYNALHPGARRRAPDSKTLFTIASRMPKNVAELSRIKGIPRGMSTADRNRVMDVLIASGGNHDFQALEAPTYGSFEEILAEGWLSWARACVCVEARVAPELALPNRVLKRMLRALVVAGEEDAWSCLAGWRAKLMLERLRRFAEKHPLSASAETSPERAV